MKSKIGSIFAVVLTLVCLASTGCPRPSAECRNFYDLPPEQQVPFLRAAPIEKQLDLYECGVYQEPPMDLSDEVTDGGERIIPALLVRLKSVERPHACFKGELLRIFERLAERGELRGRQDVLEQLRAVPASIPFDVCRPKAQERLRNIEQAYSKYP
jgi:hypothetical protein